jgi:23S rRNA pseudouridine2604 synthase
MSYRDKLQYLLVRVLAIANAKAKRLIAEGQILVNGIAVTENVLIQATDQVEYHSMVVQQAKQMRYVALYKPRGIETTLNASIENNLTGFVPFAEKLFPVGRLDKESEGLLLMTNDGTLFNAIIGPDSLIEKEYIVQVNKPINESFLSTMASGVTIMGKQTWPCKLSYIDSHTFGIVLQQGLNRQIRRMCYQLGFEVLMLKRIRIANILLDTLVSGEYRLINRSEMVLQ